MGYLTLQHTINDLRKKGEVIDIDWEVDPFLEMAEIHRRINRAGGPAILYHNVKNSPYKALSNLYGTYERTTYLFRHEMETIKHITSLKADPSLALKEWKKSLKSLVFARHSFPRKTKKFPFKEIKFDKIPRIVSWPGDGGSFITLPQVCSLPPDGKSMLKSNIGMYRIQLDGNDYVEGKEIGLHYQLHRGIGIHQKMYQEQGKEFRISIFVGGPPSHTFTSIMPLPEGLSEVTFSGLLNGKSYNYNKKNGYYINTAADFVITGRIKHNSLKPEGPFGDHLGYYSLEHLFPVLEIEKVYARENAIWHFTVVGRPPAEDSNFGALIHEIVSPLMESEFPGIHSINAVDVAGVHPLLLAVGSERYMPFRQSRPEEVLTIAHHLLGKGQTSLTKYLFIVNHYDNPMLNAYQISDYFKHFLERVRWERDLHFITKTTIDTLDYSGDDWNAGSKVIAAAVGPQSRTLGTEIPSSLALPIECKNATIPLPGVIAISGSAYKSKKTQYITDICNKIDTSLVESFPLIVLTDDASFTSSHLNNFLWEVFTRSNPANDIYGVSSFQKNKHWGCKGSLVIDARTKPHHAPVLIEDPEVSRKVNNYFKKGSPLHYWDI